MVAGAVNLEHVGRLLTQAYEVTRVISVLADVVRANQIAKSVDDLPPLSPHQEDSVLSAIGIMSDQMQSLLCSNADSFEDQFEKLEARANG